MNAIANAQRTLLRGLVSLALSLALPLAALASTPAPASEYGYDTITYESTFTTKTVDMNRTLDKGYKWYLVDLFGLQASALGVKLNSDASATLVGDKPGVAGSLATMAPYRGTNTFVGTAFGGGFYIEAVFNFNYAQVAAANTGAHPGTPAFWSLPVESIGVYGTNQWPGQAAGYEHNVEFDFFEADYWTTKNGYGMGLHDWYGIPGKTCPPGMCGIGFTNPSGARFPPAGTNFSKYHTYGTLWVPATAKTQGICAAYFDGEVIGHTRNWTQYTNQPPTPVGKTWAFGRVDQQHMFFILGSAKGQDFNVKSVTVYQKNASENVVH
jgi:hypothetical protein